jgi:predicted glycosyltransferase
MTRRSSLLFYCQHSLGMGHLMRSLALVRACSDRFDVTLVLGGRLPRRMTVPDGVRVVTLPPVGIDVNGGLVSHDGRRSLHRAMELRRDLVASTVRALRPDAVVIELFPFGRRKFTSEIVTALEIARERPGSQPVVCCSLRDILVSRHERQAAHDAHAAALLARHFDHVLVHSDERFARLEESLAGGTPLGVPVHYTGFVHDPGTHAGVRPRTRAGSVVVSAGGGMVGAPLLYAAIEASAALGEADAPAIDLVAGPLLPEDQWRELVRAGTTQPRVRLHRAVPNLSLELSRARASISQCGYNTVMDVLASRVPALVVPFGDAREDEQRKRADRLARLGLVRVLPADALSAPALAGEIRALQHFRPGSLQLDMHGAARSADILAALCAGAELPAAAVEGMEALA